MPLQLRGDKYDAFDENCIRYAVIPLDKLDSHYSRSPKCFENEAGCSTLTNETIIVHIFRCLNTSAFFLFALFFFSFLFFLIRFVHADEPESCLSQSFGFSKKEGKKEKNEPKKNPSRL